MECNKDDSIKCKGIAEKKLENEDIAGANKFALKAKSLFPNLEGLSALLEVINLYVASQKKINGELDLYGIFGLDPSVDDDTVRKKYRKMALVFHPDKNKSSGAAGAFLILHEAFGVLSNKDKRSAYNLKLKAIECKGIAEKKLENEDIAGANKYALKAQSLFPNLDGLSALLEVINLYVASQKKINGELDLYGIFGLDPSVDDDTVRKKYRKMALVFHPDKNKSSGAAGAFLILHEAFGVLSNKDKRSAYNLKLKAIECKGIAEKKLENEDIVGANKYALKAQSLFPNLDGLSALLEVINLYVASQKKINGELDLYGIFGLDPSVDDDTVRKKYRKMALVFHPDKNKSSGAAGAFLILHEAFGVLSDKDKRSAYNLKLKAIECKGIAEKKLENEDIAGANKYALKAQSLFSNLDGLSALLEVINLYVASQKKINGEVDLYGIFGLDPSVDDDTLRKKYRKMSVVFHPDENKSTGAAGAFLILTEAFSVLSDKDKRSAYNLKLKAIKCKGIAEKKLENEDIAGANKYALKAQSLFPNLDGLSALLEVINIYVASQKKINGEVYLYGIFGLDPSVDDDTLHKKYRKMSVVFHPDENKSTGAAGAFLILHKAFSVLSDKDKRSAYNLKLNLRAPNPPLPTDRNDFCNFTSISSSQNVRNKATDAKTQHMPTHSRTSAPATSSHVNPALFPKNSEDATGAQHVPRPKKTKKTATSSRYAATPPRPREPKTATTVHNIPCHKKTSKTATSSTFVGTASKPNSGSLESDQADAWSSTWSVVAVLAGLGVLALLR